MSETLVAVSTADGRHFVWTFPGTEGELRNEWLDGFGPFHLMPRDPLPPRDILGPVEPVEAPPAGATAWVYLDGPDNSRLVSAAGELGFPWSDEPAPR